MPTPPALSQEGIPTFGSLPQHVPRLTDGIITPGAISTSLPAGFGTTIVAPAAAEIESAASVTDDHRLIVTNHASTAATSRLPAARHTTRTPGGGSPWLMHVRGGAS